MLREIEGEPAFPIYSVGFKFQHPIADPEKVKDYPPAPLVRGIAGRPHLERNADGVNEP